jgi:hypothetical protein
VNTLSARKKITLIVTPTPILTLALVDKPLCFSVLGDVVLCCGLSKFGLDVLELGLGALELGLDVLGFGVDMLEFGFGVLVFGVDEGEFEMEVLESGFDIPIGVSLEDEAGGEARVFELEDFAGLTLEGEEVDEETKEGAQFGRVKSLEQLPELQ